MRDLVAPFSVPFMGRALAELLLLAVVCGPVSVLVFLRRLAFVADALTHTVFPGLVIGFLVAGWTGIAGGALVAALLTAVALTVLTRWGRLSDDTTVAVLLTAMFSLGVVLVSRQHSYTSDLTAFLFGRLLTVTPAQLTQTAVLAAIVLTGLAVTARPLVLRAFDPIAAATAGYRLTLLDLGLNTAVALVVVAAVQAVGTILVIALLIVPAATARLLTDRLAAMAVIATAVTGLAAYLGLLASWTASVRYGVRLTSAAAVVLILMVCYLLALLAGQLRRRPHPPAVTVTR
ncbi:Manganese transport system membrane protein MntB [Micromonospora sp. MH33]|uniref:metal ABC transporter permease n=1 Tax=Micromonospora sp. MH33 TaxID=1945509 RepID=UPI000D14BF39|nr:metal ABC transporter permease [Micromonospora sp. MH33]PSK67955.1 Manganese transport system membrane protein MntB [Micromonospora sp. MH33]